MYKEEDSKLGLQYIVRDFCAQESSILTTTNQCIIMWWWCLKIKYRPS